MGKDRSSILFAATSIALAMFVAASGAVSVLFVVSIVRGPQGFDDAGPAIARLGLIYAAPAACLGMYLFLARERVRKRRYMGTQSGKTL
jgi:hypothetical protein